MATGCHQRIGFRHPNRMPPHNPLPVITQPVATATWTVGHVGPTYNFKNDFVLPWQPVSTDRPALGTQPVGRGDTPDGHGNRLPPEDRFSAPNRTSPRIPSPKIAPPVAIATWTVGDVTPTYSNRLRGVAFKIRSQGKSGPGSSLRWTWMVGSSLAGIRRWSSWSCPAMDFSEGRVTVSRFNN